MIKTLIGLILLIFPFLFIIKFKEGKQGFLYTISLLISFHLVIAMLTQALHIFTYGVILTINLLVSFIVIIKTNFKELINRLKEKITKIDWVLILVIFILFIELFSVHYNYTGKITLVTEPTYREVKNMEYVYPYFSDEWYAVSLIEYSINSNSLPLKNPLQDKTFLNLELPFHSFISEIMLLLDLRPLTQYSILALFSGLLICLLVYFFLIFNKVQKLPAAITILFVPYIVNGATLPGVWYLLPITMGIISILLSFFFMSSNNNFHMFIN